MNIVETVSTDTIAIILLIGFVSGYVARIASEIVSKTRKDL